MLHIKTYGNTLHTIDTPSSIADTIDTHSTHVDANEAPNKWTLQLLWRDIYVKGLLHTSLQRQVAKCF